MHESEDPGQLAAMLNRLPRPWLIGVDVDGTLAPIASLPERAALEPQAREVLDALTRRVGVIVAVVSGRSLHELRHFFELPDSVVLIGSHGAETGVEVDARTVDEEERLEKTIDMLAEIVRDVPGAWIEHKPLGLTLHMRLADPERALAAMTEIESVLEGIDGVTVHRGKMVLEAALRPATKAAAFTQLRQRLEPATAVFIGDDAADENVFRSLRNGHVSIKVGPGPTAAAHRLHAPRDVVALLRALADSADEQPRVRTNER